MLYGIDNHHPVSILKGVVDTKEHKNSDSFNVSRSRLFCDNRRVTRPNTKSRTLILTKKLKGRNRTFVTFPVTFHSLNLRIGCGR